MPAVFPPTQTDIIPFVVYKAMLVDYKTLKNYLYAIKHYCLFYNKIWDWKQMPVLMAQLEGIRAAHGYGKPDERLPVTWELCTKLISHLDWQNNYYHCLIAFHMITSTMGMLRSGEQLAESRNSPDPIRTPRMEDFQLHQTTIQLNNKDKIVYYLTQHLTQSKTDKYNDGVDVFIPDGPLPIVQIYTKLMQLRLQIAKYNPNLSLHPDNWFFVKYDGTPLTRKDVKNMMIELCKLENLDWTRFKNHSFRIGGATSYARRGVHSHIIQILGRWASDAFKIYIRFDNNSLASMVNDYAQKPITKKNYIFYYKKEAKKHPLKFVEA